MVIIETPLFMHRLLELLSDDEYRKLQTALIRRPELGDIIQGSGGIRKVRWAVVGRGKSGGVRVIYYWAVSHDQLLMLYIYPKSEQSDLTPHQLRLLRKVVEESFP